MMIERYDRGSQALSLLESDELLQYEHQIQTAMQQAFYEVGQCLMQIQGRKLYRENYSTFEAYCWKRWELKRVQAYRMIGAAKVFENLQQRALSELSRPASPIGYSGQDVSQIMPMNESQTRVLADYEPEEQAHIWQNVLEQTGGQGITTELVKQVAQRSGFRRKAGTSSKPQGKRADSEAADSEPASTGNRCACYVCGKTDVDRVYSSDPTSDALGGVCRPCAQKAVAFFDDIELKMLRAQQKR